MESDGGKSRSKHTEGPLHTKEQLEEEVEEEAGLNAMVKEALDCPCVKVWNG